VAGDVIYSTIPADLNGFGEFQSSPNKYDPSFTMHALPSVRATGTPGVYTQPEMLFWNDDGNGAHTASWYSAFDQLGLVAGVDYDIYHTNAPSSGVGNGIGGRTIGLALEGYQDLLYTSGAHGRTTLSNGDFDFDPGNDIAALLTWLSAGNKDLFLTGNSLASDLESNAGPAGASFLATVMGLDFTSDDVRPLIDNQVSPLVKQLPNNPVLTNIESWYAVGNCEAPSSFDAVTIRAGTEQLAEFTDVSGYGSAYPFAAMAMNVHLATNRILSQPYDFGLINIDPNDAGGGAYAGRVQILSDVLSYFGVSSSGLPAATDQIPTIAFSTSCYPNPFNPVTKIVYTIKAAGHLSLKVYNVRGELVKTLIDDQVTADSFVMWDGTNDQGGNVASGVYFYEARMGQEVEVNKMALVK